MTRTEAGIVATRLMGCVNDQPFVDAVGETKKAGHLRVSNAEGRVYVGISGLECGVTLLAIHDPEAPWNCVLATDGNRYPVTDSKGQPLYPLATFPPESADVRYVIVERSKSGALKVCEETPNRPSRWRIPLMGGGALDFDHEPTQAEVAAAVERYRPYQAVWDGGESGDVPNPFHEAMSGNPWDYPPVADAPVVVVVERA